MCCRTLILLTVTLIVNSSKTCSEETFGGVLSPLQWSSAQHQVFGTGPMNGHLRYGNTAIFQWNECVDVSSNYFLSNLRSDSVVGPFGIAVLRFCSRFIFNFFCN